MREFRKLHESTNLVALGLAAALAVIPSAVVGQDAIQDTGAVMTTTDSSLMAAPPPPMMDTAVTAQAEPLDAEEDEGFDDWGYLGLLGLLGLMPRKRHDHVVTTTHRPVTPATGPVHPTSGPTGTGPVGPGGTTGSNPPPRRP